MPTENPYQSPEQDATPDSDPTGNDRLFRKYPTWRFWLLVASCVPLLVVGYFAGELAFSYREIYFVGYFFSILLVVFSITWVASIAVILFTWRSPAEAKQTTFLGALWMLSLLAATSAFMSFCTPGVGVSDWLLNLPPTLFFVPWGFGLSFGAVGLWLIVLLARGLWLDATGRPHKPEDEPLNRPIQRLRARNRTGDE